MLGSIKNMSSSTFIKYCKMNSIYIQIPLKSMGSVSCPLLRTTYPITISQVSHIHLAPQVNPPPLIFPSICIPFLGWFFRFLTFQIYSPIFLTLTTPPHHPPLNKSFIFLAKFTSAMYFFLSNPYPPPTI